MPGILNNVSTADQYSDALTCVFGRPSQKVNVIVANAAAYIQFGRVGQNGRPDGTFTQEEFQVPGAYSKVPPFPDNLNIVGSVRFRSAKAGVPASVTARGQ